ncbi:MAG: methyltransferase domain-containing protein [Bacteroidota bacterium]
METVERHKTISNLYQRSPSSPKLRNNKAERSDYNHEIFFDSLASLKLKKRNRVLELGVSSLDYLPYLFEQAQELKYFCLDTVKERIVEAKIVHKSLSKSEKVLFSDYNGIEIDYVKNFFDRILVVNDICFWQDPKAILNELHRVLRPGGVCIISFFEAEYFNDAPEHQHPVNVFDITKFAKLASSAPFSSIDIQTKSVRAEQGSEKIAPTEFLVARLGKSPETKAGDISADKKNS